MVPRAVELLGLGLCGRELAVATRGSNRSHLELLPFHTAKERQWQFSPERSHCLRWIGGETYTDASVIDGWRGGAWERGNALE